MLRSTVTVVCICVFLSSNSYADGVGTNDSAGSANGIFNSLKNGISAITDTIETAAKQSGKQLRQQLEQQSPGQQSDNALLPQKLFTPIDPKNGGEFEGLFANAPQVHLVSRKVKWPRAAITYVKYGANLACWTIRATIWKNASNHHDETFKVCSNQPIIIKDDLGNEAGQVNNMALMRSSDDLKLMQAPVVLDKIANTGAVRTGGPNPPQEMFNIQLADNNLSSRLNDINVRLLWISGMRNIHQGVYDEGASDDFRMWYWKFEKDGLTK